MGSETLIDDSDQCNAEWHIRESLIDSTNHKFRSSTKELTDRRHH